MYITKLLQLLKTMFTANSSLKHNELPSHEQEALEIPHYNYTAHGHFKLGITFSSNFGKSIWYSTLIWLLRLPHWICLGKFTIYKRLYPPVCHGIAYFYILKHESPMGIYNSANHQSKIMLHIVHGSNQRCKIVHSTYTHTEKKIQLR